LGEIIQIQIQKIKVIMKKGVIISIVFLLIAGLITWRLIANKQEINSKKDAKIVFQNITVTVANVQKGTGENTINLTGTTEANQEVMVASKASGEITTIFFKLGDYIPKGKVLAQVDNTYCKLTLENAKINYNKYKEDLQRYKTLKAGDAVSETQLRDIKVSYESAKIQLKQAQNQLADTYIRAPFSGYITSREIDLGKYVSASTAIAGIADLSNLKVVLSVPEFNVYDLKNGLPVSIQTQIYPEITFTGKIARISPKGDDTHSYVVEVSLLNSKQHPLKAGTYVTASIDMGEQQPTLLIPRNAIVSSIKEPSVYRVEGQIVKLVKISIGKSYESKIEVLQGLQEGDNVVVNGQINLMDGAHVSIIKN